MPWRWRMCIPPTTIGRFPVASHSSKTSNAFQSSLSSSILATRVSLSSVDSHGSSSTTSFAEPSASAECIPAAWSWTPPVPAPPIVSPRTLLSTVFRLPPCALLPSVSVSRPAVSRPEGLIVDSRVRRSGWAPPIDTWRLERIQSVISVVMCDDAPDFSPKCTVYSCSRAISSIVHARFETSSSLVVGFSLNSRISWSTREEVGEWWRRWWRWRSGGGGGGGGGGGNLEDALDRRADADHLHAPVALARALEARHHQDDAEEADDLDDAEHRHRAHQLVGRGAEVELDGDQREGERDDDDERVDPVEEVAEVREAEGVELHRELDHEEDEEDEVGPQEDVLQHAPRLGVDQRADVLVVERQLDEDERAVHEDDGQHRELGVHRREQ